LCGIPSSVFVTLGGRAGGVFFFFRGLPPVWGATPGVPGAPPERPAEDINGANMWIYRGEL
jgi:hypothetical protein